MKPRYQVGDHIRIHIRGHLGIGYDDRIIYEIVDNRYYYQSSGFDQIKIIDNPMRYSGVYSKIELLHRKTYDTKLGKILYK